MSTYSFEEQQALLNLVKESIAYGLKNHRVITIDSKQYPKTLRESRACFVTLKIAGRLRGCIGSLQAHQPLCLDVAHNAYAAAFSDPRFSPLTAEEFPNLQIHISVLSPPEPLAFTSEQDLLKKMRPKIDGLILTEGFHRGTFLPSVWEELPDPVTFLKHLKMKAGLPPDYWSEKIKIERYTAESITY